MPGRVEDRRCKILDARRDASTVPDMTKKLTIGFVRRGFSSSGGAEAYLKRLAAGLAENGHTVRLFASMNWPPNEWTFGPLTHIEARSAIAFADEIDKLGTGSECDLLMSFEPI